MYQSAIEIVRAAVLSWVNNRIETPPKNLKYRSSFQMFPDDGSSTQIPTDVKLKDIDVSVETEIFDVWHL
jgi:hypothetical protein